MFASLQRRLGRKATSDRKAPARVRYALLGTDNALRTFAKSYPDHVRVEFSRGTALAEIGTETGLFTAPKPVEVIESRRIILWEYIEGLCELRDFLVSRANLTKDEFPARLFFNIGKGLAAIHRGLLRLPGRGEFNPLEPVTCGNTSLDRHVASEMSRCPRANLHWDFSCGNIFIRENDDYRFVVIDPAPNLYISQGPGPNVRCPVYVDIGQFLFSLYCHPLFSRQIASTVNTYADRFMSGYSEFCGAAVDRAVAFASAASIAYRYQQFLDSRGPRVSLADRMDDRFRRRSREVLIAKAIAALDQPNDSAVSKLHNC